MKKYQLWLQRKSYSQHLFNLLKIKFTANQINKTEPVNKVHKKHNSNDECTFLSRYKQMQEYQQSTDNLNDLNYAITYKQLRNRKMRLMKTFQIMNQNLSMARRLKQTKSAVHSIKERPKSIQISKTRRKIQQKKLKLTNQQIRNKKYNQFKKVCQTKLHNKLNKYFFKLEIINFTKLLRSPHQFSQIWCQISTNKGFSRSQSVSVQNLFQKKFVFSLENPLNKEIILRLMMSKGLCNEIIGQFAINVPPFKQQNQFWIKSLDHRYDLQLKIKYDKINKVNPHLLIK